MFAFLTTRQISIETPRGVIVNDLTDSKNTIFSAKRVIGEKWHSYRATEFRSSYPFDFVLGSDGGLAVAGDFTIASESAAT